MAFEHCHLQNIPFCIADSLPVPNRRLHVQLGSQQLGLADADYAYPFTGLRGNSQIFFRHRRHVHGLARHLQHRLALPQQSAVLYYQRAALYHVDRLEGPKSLKGHDIRLITRRQRADLLQSVALGNVQRRHGNQVFRFITERHTDIYQIVDAALLNQIVRVPVIGTQAKPPVIRFVQHRKQIHQIMGRAAFPQEHIHAPFNFLQRFRRRNTFMFRRNPGSNIGIQVFAGNARRMSVHLLLVEQLQLIHFSLQLGQNAGEIHHFRQPQHTGTQIAQPFHIFRGDPGAGGVHIRRRHTGRNHQVRGKRNAFRLFQHKPEALFP